MMTKTLYLVRHGQTLFNVKTLMQGWVDSPLTEAGIEQAERIGRYVAHEHLSFDHAYASTLTRTQATLELITAMPYGREPGLREWYFGLYEGERYDILPPRPWNDFFVAFGGETQQQLRDRMVETLTDIMNRPDHECVLAVSSASACKEFRDFWHPEFEGARVPGNCSIMRFTYDGTRFELARVLEQDDLKVALGE